MAVKHAIDGNKTQVIQKISIHSNGDQNKLLIVCSLLPVNQFFLQSRSLVSVQSIEKVQASLKFIILSTPI